MIKKHVIFAVADAANSVITWMMECVTSVQSVCFLLVRGIKLAMKLQVTFYLQQIIQIL